MFVVPRLNICHREGLKILVVTSFFPPSEAIAAQRAHGFVKVWREEGHEVTVLSPFAPSEVVVSAPLLLRLLQRLFGRKTASRNGGAEGGQGGLLARIKRRILTTGIGSSVRWPDPSGLWYRQAFGAIKDQGPWDVIVSSFGPPGAHVLACRLKSIYPEAFWVADFRDLWTRNPLFPGWAPVRWYERSLERRILQRADLVTTVSEPLAVVLRSLGAARVEVIMNGFDPKEFKERPARRPGNGPIQLLYTGSYYPSRMRVEVFLDALARICGSGATSPDVEIFFFGPRTDEIVRKAVDRGLGDRVHGGEIRPRAEVLSYLRGVDGLLFFGYQDENAPDEGVLTGKLFEYLGSGRPILGIGLSERQQAGRMIAANPGGRIVSGDIDEVTSVLRTFLEAPPAVASVAHPTPYERRTQALRLLGLVEASLGERGASGSRL